MLKPLYRWIVKRSSEPGAVYWMSAVSFAESSFFPLPPDVMLVPMCLAQPKRLWWYTTICSIASIIGGLFGYAVGYYVFEAVGRPIIAFYGAEESFAHFQAMFNLYGPWFLILKGVTPIPYKLLAIAAGFAKLDMQVFVLCSLVARFTRYYMIGILLHYYGPEVEKFIEKRLMLVTGAILAIVVGGFLSLKFL
ncbi:MAG: DedA family protein [Azospirillum sp.]|nr:DedA family protein [Azospirillum sp.]